MRKLCQRLHVAHSLVFVDYYYGQQSSHHSKDVCWLHLWNGWMNLHAQILGFCVVNSFMNVVQSFVMIMGFVPWLGALIHKSFIQHEAIIILWNISEPGMGLLVPAKISDVLAFLSHLCNRPQFNDYSHIYTPFLGRWTSRFDPRGARNTIDRCQKGESCSDRKQYRSQRGE